MKLLKRSISVFFAVLLIFSFSACSDDDAITPTSMMTGEWEITSLNYTGISSSGGSTVGFSGVGRKFTYTINFLDNPKVYNTSGGYTVSLTTDGSSATDFVLDDFISNGTWSIKDNDLTLTNPNNESSTSKVVFSNLDNFSMDFADLFGKSVGGVDVIFTSGKVKFRRKKKPVNP